MQEQEPSTSSHDAFLAQAGLDLMSCRAEDDVFEVIVSSIGRLAPSAIIIVAQAGEQPDTLRNRTVLGVDQTLVAKAAKLIGFDPVGRERPIAEVFRGYFMQRRLVRMKGGIAELATGELSPAVANLVASTFDVTGAYTIGIADDGVIFGALHIFTRGAVDELPAHAIESFVYQCFLTLCNLGTQKVLKESEAKYRFLTERIKDVVWTLDPQTLRFTYVSPSVERLRGYTPEEIMAEPMDAALTPEGSAQVRELMGEQLRRLAAGEEGAGGFHITELEQPCKDGSSVWTEVVTGYHVNEKTGRPEVIGVTRDITERRRSEESLRVYAELLEASPASITVHTPEGQFLYANQQALELHGYTAEEFLELDLRDLDVPQSAAVIDERASQTLTVGSNSFEVEHRRKDGSTVPMAVSCRRGIWEGRQVVLSVATDITDLKLAEGELLASNARLEQMVYDVAEAMGRVVEVRDPYTQGHEVRVAHLAKLLAEDLGLSADEIAGVEMAAVVHDIGKLAIPAEILNKPGRLSAPEFALIKGHPDAGYEILKGIAFPWSVAEAVLQHHERMDGSGYPEGLLGDQICRDACILAVADVVEAMASHRPYRPALGVEAAIEEICSHREQYSADVVASLLRLYEAGKVVW